MAGPNAFTETVSSLSDQATTVLAAPVPFIVVEAIVAVLIYKFLQHHFRGRMDTQAQLLELRNAQLDDYREKLSGASPDAAKARIDALEERIDALEPRLGSQNVKRISPQEQFQMVNLLGQHAGAKIVIAADASSVEGSKIAKDLRRVFDAARWSAENCMVLGLADPPPSGVGLNVPDVNNLTPPQRAIVRAAKIAGLKVSLGSKASTLIPHEGETPIGELIITDLPVQ